MESSHRRIGVSIEYANDEEMGIIKIIGGGRDICERETNKTEAQQKIEIND